MKPAIEKLEKYIRLEAERSFDNRAIVGGMSRMLEPWEEEARQSGLPKGMIEAVMERLRDYGRLSPASRQEVLRGLWRRLMSEEDELDAIPVLDRNGIELDSRTEPQAEEVAQSESIDPSEPQTADRAADEGTDADDENLDADDFDDDDVGVDEEDKTVETDGTKRPRARTAPTSRKAMKADDEAPAALDAPLTTISGIGPKSAKTLRKLGLETLGDLLWHFPRRYDDYSQLETINRLWYGQEVTIIANIEQVKVRPIKSGKMKLTEAVVSDGTGNLRVTWFNQPWIARQLKPGQPVVLSSKVDQYLGHLVMNNPEWEPLETEQLHTNRIVPVYPLTAGVTAKWMRKVLHSVVRRLAPRIPDPIPQSVQKSAKLIALPDALEQVHFPDDWEALKRAQHRLAFDEMFLLQLGVLGQKASWEELETQPLAVDDAWLDRYLGALPFALTSAQERALADLRGDLAQPRPMNRLLEGDVGSGKTVVAAAGIGIAFERGAQSALMAPTSILAEQHYATLSGLLPEAVGIDPSQIRLLLGSTPESEKAEIRAGLAAGEIGLVIGTHALLEDPVSFHNLGLAIIDEQHRFGVDQRALLRSKGEAPNLLVMTATPIPRSLALTIYGDLDLTIIDEMPPGRMPVKTRVLSPVNRSRAYNFIEGQLEQGHQAFVIYPLVEGSEKVQAKAAVDEYEVLKKRVFFNYDVGLLHGRMKADEKEEVMAAFRAGELDVLVSTSVVEVGVDIPNATVVMIEGANRFGLSQLHQFRGRVGRSEYESYCLLIPDSDEEMDNERLKAMEATNDGFELAERDLEQRGPGDFFGTRQSGFAEIRMAQLTDVRLIEKARKEAHALFERDPELEQPENRGLRQAVDMAWTDGRGEIS
ncbi:MAG: ATP-dependent DNA helicase RecG [Anaerolineales bacterium]